MPQEEQPSASLTSHPGSHIATAHPLAAGTECPNLTPVPGRLRVGQPCCDTPCVASSRSLDTVGCPPSLLLTTTKNTGTTDLLPPPPPQPSTNQPKEHPVNGSTTQPTVQLQQLARTLAWRYMRRTVQDQASHWGVCPVYPPVGCGYWSNWRRTGPTHAGECPISPTRTLRQQRGC